MAKVKETPERAKAHIQYQLGDGTRVPGVSTIVGLLDKSNFLVPWANRLGLQGIDSRSYVDDKAAVGTLAHALIMADLRGEVLDTSEYSAWQIGQAETAFLQWLDWRGKKVIEPILIEEPLVSESYRVGGKPDFYGRVDGTLILMDYKTGGVFREATIQTCGYVELLLDNNYERPDRIVILGIPRDPSETFREVVIRDFEHGAMAFHCLRALYDELKYIK